VKRGASLRLRLVALTTLAVGLVWLVTALFTWRSALHEIEELLNHPPASARHMHEERAELAGEIAEHLLVPMLYALPVLAIVLVIAVGISLRPLGRLSADIAQRAPGRLAPIDAADAPGEIQPLIARLNALFAGIERALDNERRFTADASHELRTPLAALRAQAQVALAAGDDAGRRHALQQILAGCDRATHLLAQLLTLARLDADSSAALAPVALRPLAAAVLAEAAGEAIDRACELALGEGEADVRGDATLLQAAVRNLVENALRHGAAAHIRVDITATAELAAITIADDGRGIAADEREAVQQRFRRGAGEHDHQGSGLGLSIVRRIAELHGGRLELGEGLAGRGLSARLSLPLGSRT